MKQLLLPVLNGYPCFGASLCSLHVPNGFGGSAGTEVTTGHIFPQGVLTAITLVGDVAGDWRG